MRSIDPLYPVDGIAHEFSGGGHKLAAGAKLKNKSLSEVVDTLIAKVNAVLASA